MGSKTTKQIHQELVSNPMADNSLDNLSYKDSPVSGSTNHTAPVVIPYSFKDEEEIEYFINIAKQKSIDDLFLMSESIWDKILVAKSSEVITFYSVDTVYSYFQDLFPTTHYVMIVGNPGAGKGAILVSFKLQG